MIRLIATILFITVFTGCDDLLLGDQDTVVSLEENLQTPPLMNDGWDVSTPAAEEIDAIRLQNWITALHKNPRYIHSVLIARNNKLVTEAYFSGWNRDRLHTLRSVSKSFISTLTGIAVDQGHITTNAKVFDFFPEYSHLIDDERKETLEIRHLLTMTSGFLWDEKTYDFFDARNDQYGLDTSNDRLAYILGKPMAATPGLSFLYNSGLPFLQAAIIERTTGQSIRDFSDTNFFQKLGITNYYWRQEDDGMIPSVGPLFLRPRDIAKLGQLFLDGGVWKGEQIVSSEWVSEATATFIGNEWSADGYGYNWWTVMKFVEGREVRWFMARGAGGQYIFVVPDFSLVVTFTAGNYDEDFSAASGFEMLMGVILPSMM
jgi:CubicO group peptidase (beta-lactamase class C family)